MIVSTSSSVMHSMTIDTSSRSSTSASNATSPVRRRAPAPSSASVRRTSRGGSPRTRCRCRSSPGPTDVLPARDAARDLATGRGRGCRGSHSAATNASTPSAEERRRQDRRRVVAAAVYGYWSAPTSRPSARAGLEDDDRPPAVDRPRGALEVRHLEPRRVDAGPAARVAVIASSSDVEQPVGLVAHVRRVQTAAARRGGDQRRDLVGRRRGPRRVDEPRRQPERAGVHRGIHLADHRRRSSRWRDPGRPARGRTRGPYRDRRGTRRSARAVPRRPRRGTRRRSASGRPSSFGRSDELDELAAGVGDRRERVAAVAGQLGREALAEVAGQRAVEEQRAVGMAVGVDEPGRHDSSGGVDRVDARLGHGDRSPMARIRSPSTPTSARRPGARVPSTTVPPR